MRREWILSATLLALMGCGAAPETNADDSVEQDEVATGPMLRALPVRTTAPVDAVPIVDDEPGLILDAKAGTNVDVSRQAGPQSETDIAIDPTNPKHLIGGSNDIAGNNMRVFESFDGGQTWTNKALPLGPSPFNSSTSDPTIAFDLAGDAYYVFIAIDAGGNTSLASMKKAHGATKFGEARLVPNVGADKELMTVDQTSSAFKNRVYIAWDDNTATAQRVMLAHSIDGGNSYKAVKVNHSGANVIGADPAVGPDGEVYVAWSNYASGVQKLFINRSTDGGRTFGKTDHLIHHWVADTAGGLSVNIPADPQRGVSVFASIDVDRTKGPNRGTVYCVYNDATAKNGLDVFLRKSTDGGVTWSAPKRVNDDKTGVVRDQFMPRLAVDQSNGSVDIVWYDTRDDSANVKTDVFFTHSADGGDTFAPNLKVTTARSDEATASSDGNGYGDYLGIAAAHGVARPLWTDSRKGNEEIFTAAVTP